MTPPQTYDLTAYSLTAILFVAAVFMWLLAKMFLNIVQWFIDKRREEYNRMAQEEEDEDNEQSDEGIPEEDNDNTVAEPPDLDTKKGK